MAGEIERLASVFSEYSVPYRIDLGGAPVPEHLRDATLPKFRPDGILLVHAGGGAGLFSAMIGGWANGSTGSQPVTRRVVGRTPR